MSSKVLQLYAHLCIKKKTQRANLILKSEESLRLQVREKHRSFQQYESAGVLNLMFITF